MVAVLPIPVPPSGGELATWNGPVDVSYEAEFAGDPYDPTQNDCRFEFLPDVGQVAESRAAWYDGDGGWRTTFVTRKPGPYRVRFVRNGKQRGEPFVVNVPAGMAKGFVEVGPNRLVVDGRPIWPLGMNLAWQSEGLPKMTETIAKMGGNGLDWVRIWATHWDGRNPLWSPSNGASLDPAAIAKWSLLFDAAREAKLRIQFTFFHHGPVSSTVNSNWKEHPWNAANPGGWLKDPKDWFTDPESLRRQRLWLRYAASRWGSSGSLFAWELFNEVEWTDLAKADPAAVGKWHRETKTFLRSVDPYARPILSSSAPELNASVFSEMDLLQPHVYAADPAAGIRTATPSRLGFIGEFGTSDGRGGGSGEALRDGVLASLLANHGGGAMWWNWDDVEKNDYWPVFRRLAEIARETGIADRPGAKPFAPSYDPGKGGTFVAAPGRDWAEQVKGPIGPDGIDRMSAFLQGKAHPEMGREVTLQLDLPKPSTVRLTITSISAGGAALVTTVGGKPGPESAWPGTGKDQSVSEVVTIPVPAGPTTVVLRNDGADWFRMGRIEIPGAGPLRTIRAVGEPEWAILDVRGEGEMEVGDLPFPDGARRIRLWPFAGDPADGSTTIVRGRARLRIPKGGALLWLRP